VRSLSISPQPTNAPKRVAVFTHGRPEAVGEAPQKVEEAARLAGVELVESNPAEADLVVALGGDGTMLRALRATLGSRTPVFGVRFGRVGFLTSANGNELGNALPRIFAGDYRTVELATLQVAIGGDSHAVVNDLVVTSSAPGRMVELGWEIGGEDLGSQPCDGMICCTPTGSTAYNLSNGGPVMMWGLEAMAITFVAPHSLHARPIVVPRGTSLRIANRSPDLALAVLVDGHQVGELPPAGEVEVTIGDEKCVLARLPDVSFFSRYHEVFP
jgi:NAD+ kinase